MLLAAVLVSWVGVPVLQLLGLDPLLIDENGPTVAHVLRWTAALLPPLLVVVAVRRWTGASGRETRAAGVACLLAPAVWFVVWFLALAIGCSGSECL